MRKTQIKVVPQKKNYTKETFAIVVIERNTHLQYIIQCFRQSVLQIHRVQLVALIVSSNVLKVIEGPDILQNFIFATYC